MSNVSGWLPNLIGPVVLADEGVPVPARPTINFTGAGVVATDNPGQNRTDITIAGGGGGGSTLPVNRPIVEKSANYALVPSTDHTVVYTSGGFTATLPASPTAGDEYVVVNAANGQITVAGNGNTILGNTTMTVAVGQAVTFTKSTSAIWVPT